MKTALSIVGIVFLVLLVFLGGVIGFAVYMGSKLDASSKAYVDESVSAITASWSEEELARRESPQFRKFTSDDQLTKLFGRFNELGARQSYGGATGQANMNFTPATGLQFTASYVAEATFQNGKAEIRINLVQVDGAWKIYGFRVDSPLFLK